MGIISNLHQCTFKSKGGVLCIATVSEKNEREREKKKKKSLAIHYLQDTVYHLWCQGH